MLALLLTFVVLSGHAVDHLVLAHSLFCLPKLRGFFLVAGPLCWPVGSPLSFGVACALHTNHSCLRTVQRWQFAACACSEGKQSQLQWFCLFLHPSPRLLQTCSSLTDSFLKVPLLRGPLCVTLSDARAISNSCQFCSLPSLASRCFSPPPPSFSPFDALQVVSPYPVRLCFCICCLESLCTLGSFTFSMQMPDTLGLLYYIFTVSLIMQIIMFWNPKGFLQQPVK